MSTYKIHMVRHGEASAGFGAHRDPGLSELGQRQAKAVADYLYHTLGQKPLRLVSSPMARAHETAEPLAELMQLPIDIEPRIAEIPSPTEDLEERSRWLREAMQGGWSELDEASQQWRQTLAQCLRQIREECVMFSHYVAINAAVGVANEDDRMRIFAPDNCSVTTLVLDTTNDALKIERLGESAPTHIN